MGAAGDIANLFMVWWDREFQDKAALNNINMRMYTRCVDDETIVCESIENNEEREDDEITMEKLKEIANNIHPSIQGKVDFLKKMKIEDFPF